MGNRQISPEEMAAYKEAQKAKWNQTDHYFENPFDELTDRLKLSGCKPIF